METTSLFAETGETITPRRAAELLGTTPGYVHVLARKGCLHRLGTPRAARFLADEVAALSERRRQKREAHHDPRANLRWWGDRARTPLPEENDLITTREVARRLGIHQDSVSRLVRHGILPGFQRRPGMSGSPIYVRALHVQSLSRQEYYLSNRARYEKRFSPAPPESDPNPYQEEHHIRPLPPHVRGQSIRKDRGIYYTTRQTALYLGISTGRVHRLRQSGRLHGIQRPVRKHKNAWKRQCFTGYRWWFFRKEDVYALAADPAYRKYHARWQRSLPDRA